LEAQVDRELIFSGDKSKATLKFLISEGPRFRLNKVIFRGNTVFSDETLAGRIRLKQGLFVKDLVLRRDIKRLGDTYGELGYIESHIEVRRQYLPLDQPLPQWAQNLKGPAPALLNLVFTVKESVKFTVGRVNIRGNNVTQDRIIRRQVRLGPGKDFNELSMAETQSRLLETRLFDDVAVKPMGTDENVRDVLVRIVEGRTANFIIGIGANTNTGVVGQFTFTQRNFDIANTPKSAREFFTGQSFKGAGQKLTLSAEPGTEIFRFNVDWFEPMLFDQPYSLDINAYIFNQSYESYDLTRYGAVTSVGHRFLNRWYGELTARIEGVEMGDLDVAAPPEVVSDAGTFLLTSLRGTLVRDRTDNRWMPSTGDRFSMSYEQMLAGDFTFGRGSASYKIYRTLYVDALDGKHILAGRVRADYIVGDAPVFEKFYGGGIGSVRGFAFRGISPRSTLSTSDDPIGGDFRLLSGAEYSYPIIRDQLRGVVFLDAGTVSDEITGSMFRASVGFGIRLTVPFFGPVPMSLDFGFPIMKQSTDETQVFSFSLGWQF
ncbi:MAG TPA: hypothetical protein ENL03_02370, partial [Phycisphaerae bacterium]|nr:hypothetical protein [Phycisphaerae bacterium]